MKLTDEELDAMAQESGMNPLVDPALIYDPDVRADVRAVLRLLAPQAPITTAERLPDLDDLHGG